MHFPLCWRIIIQLSNHFSMHHHIIDDPISFCELGTQCGTGQSRCWSCKEVFDDNRRKNGAGLLLTDCELLCFGTYLSIAFLRWSDQAAQQQQSPAKLCVHSIVGEVLVSTPAQRQEIRNRANTSSPLPRGGDFKPFFWFAQEFSCLLPPSSDYNKYTTFFHIHNLGTPD